MPPNQPLLGSKTAEAADSSQRWRASHQGDGRAKMPEGSLAVRSGGLVGSAWRWAMRAAKASWGAVAEAVPGDEGTTRG